MEEGFLPNPFSFLQSSLENQNTDVVVSNYQRGVPTTEAKNALLGIPLEWFSIETWVCFKMRLFDLTLLRCSVVTTMISSFS